MATDTEALLSPTDVRELAAGLGLRPTKRRGQNFLVDPNTVRRLVRLADIGGGDTVLEIGPGLGSFTLGLLGRARHVVAVEVDPVLAAALPATVATRLGATAAARLDVVGADALRLAEGDLPGGAAPEVLAANLPYNIAVPLLLGLLERLPSLRRGLVMVQAEVADRLTAPPGSKVYGAPSVKLAWYAHARPAGSVPRPVFWPEPNVDSGLVAFSRYGAAGARPGTEPGTEQERSPEQEPGTEPGAGHKQGPEQEQRPEPTSGPGPGLGRPRPPELPVDTFAAAGPGPHRPPELRVDTFAAVDAAFAQRRKTLRRALAGWAGSAAAVEGLAAAAGVDPGARGETLDVDAFTRLAAARRTLAAS